MEAACWRADRTTLAGSISPPPAGGSGRRSSTDQTQYGPSLLLATALARRSAAFPLTFRNRRRVHRTGTDRHGGRGVGPH